MGRGGGGRGGLTWKASRVKTDMVGCALMCVFFFGWGFRVDETSRGQ